MRKVFLFVLAALAAAAAADPELPPGHEIAGHWLSIDYMKALEKSHSPLQAANDSSLAAVLVDAEQMGYALSVTSFHEGLNYGIRGFRIAGNQAIVEADSYDDDTETTQTLKLDLVKAPDGGQLLITNLFTEQRTTYRKLPGTVAGYVAGLTVAGSYADAKGAPYDFGNDGEATFAGRREMYEVTVDTYENNCDTFSHWNPDKPEETVWTGFKSENGKLALYNLVEGEDSLFRCDDKPFAVLTKKN